MFFFSRKHYTSQTEKFSRYTFSIFLLLNTEGTAGKFVRQAKNNVEI